MYCGVRQLRRRVGAEGPADLLVIVLLVFVLLVLILLVVLRHVLVAPVLNVLDGNVLALHAPLRELLHHLEELLSVILQQVVRDCQNVPG
jgi:hypothetical protein